MATVDFAKGAAGTSVTVRDEVVARPDVQEMILRLTSLRLTARELIAERVRAECDRRLLDRDGQIAGRLVAPEAREARLNGRAIARRGAADPEREVERALEAFGQNAFLLLIDDRQVETLDEDVSLDEGSVVTFLRLTPLVGG